MVKILKSNNRGQANHGWLESFHSFSFADYYNPEAMGFQSLRVINEDFVAPKKGFPAHPHANMEIISYVVSGQIAHKDSMGNIKIVSAGEVQAMTAGSGVEHSEFNPSDSETLHLLQIWIKPDRRGYQPSYSEWRPASSKKNILQLIASNDGREGSIKINQQVDLLVGKYDQGEKISSNFLSGRNGYWIQLIKGKLQVDEVTLESGDAAFTEEYSSPQIKIAEESQFLLFRFG